MNVRDDPIRMRRARRLGRVRTRFALLASVATVAVGVGGGLAFASTRSTSIGTGVVVIDTNLAYQSGEAAGTGMVLTASGEILTNNHVIRGASTIKIVVPGTGRSYTANVIGYDASADVAVLQASGASNLKTIVLGNSSTLKVGQTDTATGNAGGTGALTTSAGELTGLARAITVSDDEGGTEHLSGLIETNTTLEPGDSGGPLTNSSGEVIGMDTAASVGYGFQETASDDAFAIPINTAVAIAKQIEAGTATATVHIGTTAFLGVDVAADGFTTSGAAVEGLLADGAASAAGLDEGDIITAIDGKKVSSPTALEAVLLTEKPGAKISVSYLDSAGTREATTVTLASGPPQ
jgi:S1-C subfamily serine protease